MVLMAHKNEKVSWPLLVGEEAGKPVVSVYCHTVREGCAERKDSKGEG